MNAFGKINLYLRVLGKRPDGYTEIETVFLPLAFHDGVNVEFGGSGIRMECADPTLATADNLMVRAAKLYGESCGIEIACRIALEKNLFVAAGLGGGSSDAAAVLNACETRFGLAGAEKLRAIARKLGADVPFFLNPVPALGRGVGDELSPLSEARQLHFLLVNPRFGVSAKWAYTHLVPASGGATADDLIRNLATGDVAGIARHVRNDLAGGLYRKFPLLELLRSELLSRGALAAEISGSGATIFALTESAEASVILENSVKLKYGEAVKTAVTSSL